MTESLALPLAIMATFVATSGGGWLLALALGLSAVGDYFLSREDEKFTIWLVSFLTAYVLYIWLFSQMFVTPSFGWGHGGIVAFALIYGAYL